MSRHRVRSPRADRRYFRETSNWTKQINTAKFTPRGGIRL